MTANRLLRRSPQEPARKRVDAMSPDDYTNDPDLMSSRVPGTVDDIPASLEADTDSLGATDEAELWNHQKALIEEDEGGLKLEGFPPEEIPDILEAMGDDAADPLADSPNGTSATGLWSGPEHGGFPDRGE
jgi:hypothetical protein